MTRAAARGPAGLRGHAGPRVVSALLASILAASLSGCGGGDHHRPRAVTTAAPIPAATWGRYVALGDSYSAGEGDGAFAAGTDTETDRCHRSARAYPHAVTTTYHFAGGSAFWACSGATTTTMRQGQCFAGGAAVARGAAGSVCEPAQLSHLDARTSLVTFSIGGNDLGFAPVLRGCVLGGLDHCTGQQAAVAGKRAKLGGELRAILRTVHRRAPYARVVVLGYPRLFPTKPAHRVDLLGTAEQRWLNTMADRADAAVRQAVTKADAAITGGTMPGGRGGSVEYADPRKAFAGHEIGGAQPYLNGIKLDGLSVLPGSFHPTAAGQRAFAAVVDQQISAGPGRPLAARPKS